MGCQCQSFGFPISETKQGTNANPAKTSRVSAFGALKPPVEIFLRAGGVELAVSFPVVGFLINDEALGAMIDQFSILIVLHRAYFDRYGRDEGFDGINTGLEIAL